MTDDLGVRSLPSDDVAIRIVLKLVTIPELAIGYRAGS